MTVPIRRPSVAHPSPIRRWAPHESDFACNDGLPCQTAEDGRCRFNGDALRLLGVHGVVPAELAGRLRQAVGVRNVLLHEYVEVDDDIVRARLNDPSDLAKFIVAVTQWLPGDD